jgi:hypothetical protein
VLSIYKTQRNVANLIADAHQPFKKRKPIANSINFFLNNGVPYKESNPFSKHILNIEVCTSLKDFIQNIWLKRLVLWQCD